MPIIETIGGVLAARTIGGFISKISKRIFPFKGSSDDSVPKSVSE